MHINLSRHTVSPFIHLTSQSFNQPINYLNNQPLIRSVSQSIIQSTSHSFNQSANQSFNQPANHSINQPVIQSPIINELINKKNPRLVKVTQFLSHSNYQMYDRQTDKHTDRLSQTYSLQIFNITGTSHAHKHSDRHTHRYIEAQANRHAASNHHLTMKIGRNGHSCICKQKQRYANNQPTHTHTHTCTHTPQRDTRLKQRGSLQHRLPGSPCAFLVSGGLIVAAGRHCRWRQMIISQWDRPQPCSQ